MSKISKIAIGTLKWAIPSILGITILLIVAGAVFQERIVKWIVDDLQSELAIPVKVEKIRFSLIENFPNASAVLVNSTALYPKSHSNDTLFSIKRFYINLNIIDLIRGNITVRSIDLNQAKLNIVAQPDGSLPKIRLFKNETGSNTSAAFKIKSIRAKDLLLVYTNEANNYHERLSINSCSFSGTISNKTVAGQLSTKIKECTINNTDYSNYLSENATVDISGEYEYGKHISIDKLFYSAKYLSINGNSSIILSNKLKGRFLFTVNIPNKEIFTRIFKKSTIAINTMNNATVEITGNIDGPKISDVNFAATAKVNNASITVLRDIDIENISTKLTLKAYIKNNTLIPTEIVVDPTTFSLQEKEIVASLNYKPKLHQLVAKINGDISPSIFSKVLKISSPEISGDNIKINALLSSNEFSLTNFDPNSISAQGTIELLNLSVNLPKLKFNSISGSLDISDALDFRHITLDGNLGKMDISGTIPHWRQTFFSAKNRMPLEITGNLSSPYLNLNLPEWGISNETTTAPKETDTTETPLAISKIEVNFSAQQIALDHLRGTGARGTLVYVPNNSFSLNNVSLASFGGKASFNLDNRLINNENTITVSGKTHSIYVDSLFKAFHNFDQKFIGSENLSGKINADIEMKGVYENGKLLNNKLFCITTLEINDGSLKNYEPLKKLSGFVNIKELERINFKRLKNTIRIENGEITIPEMLIENNALNINLSGTHKLSGSFDYRMRVKLKDLLWAKNKSANRYRSDLGIVEQEETDGGSIFLKFTGTPDNCSFGYDKDRAIETLGKKLKQEGKTIRNIFKKDSNNSKTAPELKKNSGFKISDPMAPKEKAQTTDTTKPAPLKKNSGFKIDWE